MTHSMNFLTATALKMVSNSGVRIPCCLSIPWVVELELPLKKQLLFSSIRKLTDANCTSSSNIRFQEYIVHCGYRFASRKECENTVGWRSWFVESNRHEDVVLQRANKIETADESHRCLVWCCWRIPLYTLILSQHKWTRIEACNNIFKR